MQKKCFTNLPTLFFFGPLQETNNVFFLALESSLDNSIRNLVSQKIGEVRCKVIYLY